MVSFGGGGRSIPRVQVNIGKGTSDRDASDLAKALKDVADALQQIQSEGSAATKAVNDLVQQRKAAAAAQDTARQTREAARQAREAARPVDELAQSHKNLSDALRRVRQEYQVQQGMGPGGQIRPEYLAQYRKSLEERNSGSMRAAEAIGWAPGVPPEVFMAQRALGSLIPGISGGAMLGVTGGIGALFAGLAAVNWSAGQIENARGIDAIAGNSGRNVFQDQMDLYAAEGRTNTFDDKAALSIVQGLANEGLGRDSALGKGFDETAAAMGTFKLSVDQASKLVGDAFLRLGRDTDAVGAFLAGIARQALAGGPSAQQMAALAAANPDLLATATGANLPALLSALTTVGGDDATKGALAAMLDVHGFAETPLAGLLGLSDQQFEAMQKNDPAQLADRVLGLYRRNESQLGANKGYDLTNKQLQQFGLPGLTWTQAHDLLAQGPTPVEDAYKQAVIDANRQKLQDSGQFGANRAQVLLAQGDFGGAARASNPATPQDLAGLDAKKAGVQAGLMLTNPKPPDPHPFGRLGDLGLAFTAFANDPGAAARLLSGVGGSLSSAAGQALGGLGQKIGVDVKGMAEVVIRQVDGAGRTTGAQTISVPLTPNGQQQAQQYVPSRILSWSSADPTGPAHRGLQ